MVLRQLDEKQFSRYLRRDATLAAELGLRRLWFDGALIDAYAHDNRQLGQLPAFTLPQLYCSGAEGIGTIGVKEPRGSVLLLGYAIAPPHRTRGHATSAVALLLDWVWRTLPEVDTLRAHVDRGNLASRRVLEKNGFSVVADSVVWNLVTYAAGRN